MGKKRRNWKASRLNIAKRGKGGFTLAELVVVMAIVAIASAMIVSFSVSMGDFVDSNAEEYDFLEDCAIVEEELYKWIAEQDNPGVEFQHEDNEAGVTNNWKVDDGNRVIFASGNLYLYVNNNTPTLIKDLKTIDNLQFKRQGNLIKCTITPADSERSSKILVFALRCATE